MHSPYLNFVTPCHILNYCYYYLFVLTANEILLCGSGTTITSNTHHQNNGRSSRKPYNFTITQTISWLDIRISHNGFTRPTFCVLLSQNIQLHESYK
jgi:hypothetical protein